MPIRDSLLWAQLWATVGLRQASIVIPVGSSPSEAAIFLLRRPASALAKFTPRGTAARHAADTNGIVNRCRIQEAKFNRPVVGLTIELRDRNSWKELGTGLGAPAALA